MTLDTPSATRPAASAGGGRLAFIVGGSLLALIATALLAAGGTGLVLDQTQRDDQGYLMTPTDMFSTSTYGLVSEPVKADFDGPDWISTRVLGSVKVGTDSAQQVFVGIGPADAVERYLAGVPREEVRDLRDDTQVVLPGSARPAPPQEQGFWVAQASGAGEQSLRWTVRDGDWRAVVMAADATKGVRADLSIGARIPDLGWIAAALLGGGVLLGAAGGGLLYLGARARAWK